MREEERPSRDGGRTPVAIAILLSALLGGTCGTFLPLIWMRPHPDVGSIWGLAAGGILFNIVTLPVLSLILWLATLPLSIWLERWFLRLWFAGLFVVAGGLSGSMLMEGMVSMVAFDYDMPNTGDILLGMGYGASTAFWWWLFYRRVLIRRAALEN